MKNKISRERLLKFAPFLLKRTNTVLANTALHKRRRSIPQPLRVASDVAFCPKLNKDPKRGDGRDNCGEDAYYILDTNENELVWSGGVADGVGGFALRGIDPSLIAWELMEYCKDTAATSTRQSPKQILKQAYEKVLSENIVKGGACTATLVNITEHDDNLYLTCCNLGDSKVLIIRNKTILYRTHDQLHFFNCPYQLGVRDAGSKSEQEPDKPESANETESPIRLEKDDIIVIATDGLLDNIFAEDIVSLSSACNTRDPKKFVNQVANVLVQAAYEVSTTKSVDTPFQQYAAQHGLKLPGGKTDDITVVVAKIY
jgi:serine/threonine protein phosphatase PrpC